MSSHRPRKRFGQHFLHDPGVLERLVKSINPSGDDFVVEIGPGEGALTAGLLERAGKLEVIELDRDLASHLRERFPTSRLTVHCEDALEVDFDRFPAGMRIVGNLPYNISTPLLFHVAGYAGRVRDLHFMLQREVVERMVAAPATPQYGRLSVALQARFRIDKLFNVAGGAFRPAPKVESALVRLLPLPEPLEIDEDLLRRAFSARRKTLRNALRGVDLDVWQGEAVMLIGRSPSPPWQRAQALTDRALGHPLRLEQFIGPGREFRHLLQAHLVHFFRAHGRGGRVLVVPQGGPTGRAEARAHGVLVATGRADHPRHRITPRSAPGRRNPRPCSTAGAGCAAHTDRSSAWR